MPWPPPAAARQWAPRCGDCPRADSSILVKEALRGGVEGPPLPRLYAVRVPRAPCRPCAAATA